MAPPAWKNRYGYLEGLFSIIINGVLFGLKYWAGIVSGSLALVADAWHTLSDSASSVIVLGSVRLSSKKADEQHPFGHGRIQQIAAIFIAFLLGIIAWEFLTDSIEKFRSRQPTRFGPFAIGVTVLSILLKEGLAQYAFWTHRKTGFETLRAEGWHHRSDALSSVAILAGILLGSRYWWVDPALGALISLMLFYAVFGIIRSSIGQLMGRKPDENLLNKVKEVVRDVAGKEVWPHHFHLHTYGEHREMTFHIKLSGSLRISEGHAMASRIEEALREELDIEATIHMEPDSGKVS